MRTVQGPLCAIERVGEVQRAQYIATRRLLLLPLHMRVGLQTSGNDLRGLCNMSRLLEQVITLQSPNLTQVDEPSAMSHTTRS